MTKNVREKLLEKGWGRHSCILIDEQITQWLSPTLPESVQGLCVNGNLLIISLYDCAVINPCFLTEPWVNVLIAKKIDTPNKQFQNNRNERKLHFFVMNDGNSEAFEVNASSIIQFERNKLLELSKNIHYQIENDSSFSLKHWLAERFRRDVWPDAFNNSIKSAEKRLKKFYDRWNDYLSGIYLKLDTWEEKPEGVKYTICGIIVIEDNKLRQLRKKIKETESGLADKDNDCLDKFISNQFKVIFDNLIDWVEDPTSLLGIALALKTEGQITLSHQREFRRLNPYTLSDQDPNAPMPAEMANTF
ncbi:hypothetical protein ACPAVH_10870 [Enterobacteriaceae bacterium TYF_5]